MRRIISAILLSLFATPALAVTVTNLDDVTHQIVFEANPGNKVIRTLDPNETTRVLQNSGTVYLKGRERAVHVYSNDLLVIWKQGNLQIQKRRQARGDAF